MALNLMFTGFRDARVMWDQKTGRSRGFGFVSFRSQQVIVIIGFSLLFVFLFCTDIIFYYNLTFSSSTQDAQSAINDLTGKDDAVICHVFILFSFFFSLQNETSILSFKMLSFYLPWPWVKLLGFNSFCQSM